MCWGKNTIAGSVLLGGILLLTAPGCALHRTDRGLVLSSQWSLEMNRTPWLAFRANNGAVNNSSEQKPELAKQATAKPQDRPMTSQEWASSRPELLPWRNRLREHRLASRLFNRQKEVKEKEPSGNTAESIAAKKPQMPQAVPALPMPMQQPSPGAVTTSPAAVAAASAPLAAQPTAPVTTAEFEVDALQAPATQECELQIPDQAGSLPEIYRPDLVVD